MDWQLQDDAVDAWVAICVGDFFLERISVCANIGHFNADVFAILLFQIDVFSDNWIVGIAKNEKGGFLSHAGNLAGLALFNKACKFFAV